MVTLWNVQCADHILVNCSYVCLVWDWIGNGAESLMLLRLTFVTSFSMLRVGVDVLKSVWYLLLFAMVFL